MLSEFPKFKKFEHEDLKYLKDQHNICEFAPTNLIIWREFDKPQLTKINGNTCILITPPNEPPFFYQPLGTNKLTETLQTCLEHTGKVSRVTEDFIKLLPPKAFRTSCLRSQFDYIYETKTLAELKGKKFDGKRNHLKNFLRRHPDYGYVPITPDLKKGCLDLFETWFAQRKESRYFPRMAYDSQKAAITQAFKYYDELKFVGGALLIDQKVEGFMMASPINSEMLSVHFQYGQPAIRGIFQALIWEASNKTFNNFKYLNLEQDLGIPGLRKAKLSYNPLRLEKKYEITPAQS